MNNSVFSCSFCITTVSGAEENGRPGDSDSDISMFACRHTINLCIVYIDILIYLSFISCFLALVGFFYDDLYIPLPCETNALPLAPLL